MFLARISQFEGAVAVNQQMRIIKKTTTTIKLCLNSYARADIRRLNVRCLRSMCGTTQILLLSQIVEVILSDQWIDFVAPPKR